MVDTSQWNWNPPSRSTIESRYCYCITFLNVFFFIFIYLSYLEIIYSWLHNIRKPVLLTPNMDLYTLIPRTLVGVAYPAFASLKTVLSDAPESSVAWLRYWVVLGVFSVVELLLDPLINPLTYSFPTYLVLKCLFLVWCMAPVQWNGSDIIFNQVSFWCFKSRFYAWLNLFVLSMLSPITWIGLWPRKES